MSGARLSALLQSRFAPIAVTSRQRMAYPAQIVGRALALFTMSMFLGVAVMQWFTGFVASIAKA